MKLSWWKIFSIMIMVYALIAGFKVPLKPGVVGFNPSKLEVGKATTISINTYNTRHTQANEVAVALKLDTVSIIPASSIKVISDTEIEASFLVNSNIQGINIVENALTLIVSNDLDGYCLHPNGIYIKNQDDGGPSMSETNVLPLSSLHASNAWRFPFKYDLQETVRNTFFHVAIWFAMFLLLIVSCYYSIQYLRKKDLDIDNRVESLVNVALYFGIAGILTGSMWAKYTWGKFWTSDIKLNMSALALMVYMAYWILRRSINDPDTRARISSIYNLFAFVILMVLVMVIPRMTDSLHPGNGGNPALGLDDLDNTLRMIFYPAIIGYTLIGLWIAQLGYRLRRLRDISQFGH